MKIRKLGPFNLEVSAIGLGCMGMSHAYGTNYNDAESLKVLDKAYELGIYFWDTAEMYGPYINETLVGKALKGKPRDKIILATKMGFKLDSSGKVIGVDGSPQRVKDAIEGSLKRLDTDYIDLFYLHRLDPKTPIEETMNAFVDLIRQGKIRAIGLSEVGPGIIRRAHKIHPITAVQSEYSLWERYVEPKVLPCLRELNIGFVPFSPLGRGFLTGAFKSIDELESSDWRRTVPRFQDAQLKHNLELVNKVKQIAADYKATPAQVALAWLLRQSPDCVPIPGTKQLKYLEENAKAIELTLPESVWRELDSTIESFKAFGERYPAEAEALVDYTD